MPRALPDDPALGVGTVTIAHSRKRAGFRPSAKDDDRIERDRRQAGRPEHPQLDRRFSVTRELVEETLVQVLEVRAEGDGRLAQLLDLMYFGDWASCYLALDHDVDPGPIDAISELKLRLAGPPSR